MSRSDSAQDEPSSGAPSARSVRHAVVLVIEDDEADRRAICRSLQRGGARWSIHQSTTAEAGLAMITKLQPDCVLLDQHLPSCTGLEFLERLARKHASWESPVILITGDDSQRLGVSAMKLGVAEVVPKADLGQVDLVAVVDAALELRDRQSEQARRVYSEKLASLAQLVGATAHEINNPAAIARLTLSAVADAMNESSARSHDGDADVVVLQDVGRLQRLIQTADDALGRIGLVVRELERQTGAALGHIQALELNHAVEEARPSIERLITGGRRVEYVSDSGAALIGDTLQLSRVIVDLVENALEAVVGRGRVVVSTSTHETYVELTVDDDGPGIDAELRDRVFEPLFTTRRERGATGMGLARASAIVERHGGTISSERSPFGGARLSVRLPRKDRSSVEEQPPHSVGIPPSSGVKPSVLIVDDEVAILESYRRVLKSEYRVDVAQGVRAAFEHLAHHEYDVIICDVIMPEVDGVTFAQRLVLEQPGQAEALLFCTGGVLDPEQERYLATWANGYLRKPLSVVELKACIASFLEQRNVLELTTPA